MVVSQQINAEDIRRLVCDPWCSKCGHERDGSCMNQRHFEFIREALWTRCPDCQPDRLEHDQNGWWLDDMNEKGVEVPVSTAIDLILMKIARSGTAVCDKVRSRRPACYLKLTTSIMHGDLPGAVASMHQLLNLVDQTEEANHQNDEFRSGYRSKE